MRLLNQALKQERFMTAMTGLHIAEFERLVDETKKDWRGLKQQRILRAETLKRKRGAGRKECFASCEEQVFVTLFWLRSYPTLLMLEMLFGADEVTHWRVIRQVVPLLAKRRGIVQQPGRKRIRNMEELKEVFPEIHEALTEVIVDATEQQIQRPYDKRKNKKYRSGKKKAHTVKTQIMTDASTGRILHISKTVEGKRHDFRLFKETVRPTATDGGIRLLADSGYQGLKDQRPGLVNAQVSVKRFRGSPPLTRQQKRAGRIFAKVRVRVEHAIARLKQFDVLKDIYRHSLAIYNTVFLAVANLTNLRLDMRAHVA